MTVTHPYSTLKTEKLHRYNILHRSNNQYTIFSGEQVNLDGPEGVPSDEHDWLVGLRLTALSAQIGDMPP